MPEVVRGMTAVAAAIERRGLDYGLLTLVRLSAPQINSCAFFIHTHVKDALKGALILHPPPKEGSMKQATMTTKLVALVVLCLMTGTAVGAPEAS